ncbi:hypothetical protein AMTR_s00024p00242330 [Amborella trichopoda]|uniref:Uncharacterized protein n=1 Tax=Amborella trichopoda TaxID=13333 RepID=W1PTY6_AMBTC|nr:hypothetical protein AMTR_s00024p00242330 [Amborella trichopoda]
MALRRLHDHKPVLIITTFDQNGFSGWPIPPIHGRLRGTRCCSGESSRRVSRIVEGRMSKQREKVVAIKSSGERMRSCRGHAVIAVIVERETRF